MKTKSWTVDRKDDLSRSYPQISQAAALLKENELVAFPTETVYGLGANAQSDEAVAKIYQAKGRPSDNPLIVHVADKEQVKKIAAKIPPLAEKLMETFWPGPLTLVLPKQDGLSKLVTAGLETVAVRMPEDALALALIKESGLPIAAPSANLSGKPSPTLAEHVAHDLTGKIAGILDGGPTGVGVESTVVDCTGEVPVILRPGGITKEQLEEAVGTVEVDRALLKEGEAPKAPGMKYTHYAPKADLYIVKGSMEYLQSLVDQERAAGREAGVLTTEENRAAYDADAVLAAGWRSKPETIAAHLYEVLRQFDERDLDVIYSESFSEEGVGSAIMNRLMKAAGQRVLTENH
ncbi:threonylcarbamoyl-AMP synthase [Metabacillus sp. GX 13764]|uniref:L-threonylcarbamoyladenylate synthase n=1 Tax=Metabacillus kandeliae TaxID=2900151 RepID=UPI001E53D590|nr:L-threonylcarbamoyladenylate synthase [Metabacillus kandeliae]MCD7034678.1 threonylcarbamoyl-AMP synthase [Metabacillus kandeliae]